MAKNKQPKSFTLKGTSAHEARLAAQREVYAQVEKIRAELNAQMTPRYMAMFAFALHEEFGFGKARLGRVLGRVWELSEAMEEGYLTFEDLLETLEKECEIKL